MNELSFESYYLLVYFTFTQAFIQDRFGYISIMSKHMFRTVYPFRS